MSLAEFQMVTEFFVKNGHLIGDTKQPGLLPVSTILLRQRLMLEELGEVASACHDGDILLVADGLCDLLYVVVGSCVSFGVTVSSSNVDHFYYRAKLPPEVVRIQYLNLL